MTPVSRKQDSTAPGSGLSAMSLRFQLMAAAIGAVLLAVSTIADDATPHIRDGAALTGLHVHGSINPRLEETVAPVVGEGSHDGTLLPPLKTEPIESAASSNPTDKSRPERPRPASPAVPLEAWLASGPLPRNTEKAANAVPLESWLAVGPLPRNTGKAADADDPTPRMQDGAVRTGLYVHGSINPRSEGIQTSVADEGAHDGGALLPPLNHDNETRYLREPMEPAAQVNLSDQPRPDPRPTSQAVPLESWLAMGPLPRKTDEAVDAATPRIRDGARRIGVHVRGSINSHSDTDRTSIIRVVAESSDNGTSLRPASDENAARFFREPLEPAARVKLSDQSRPERPRSTNPAVPLESWLAVGPLNGETGEGAVVEVGQRGDGIPPEPPAPSPMASAEPRQPASASESGVLIPQAVPEAPPGYIDPRYVFSGESSVYTSTCRRCGRVHCQCVYAPFGESVSTAFGRQIYHGSAALMTLYSFDFQPQETSDPSELTSRGQYQLDKIVRRLRFTPAPIRIQATPDADLNAARRQQVVQALEARGVTDASGLVVTVRTGEGRSSAEELESSGGFLENLNQRGQTVQVQSSAGFSGAAVFGR